jgi:hypothetical protein
VSARVGVGVGRDSVRAVLVRRGSIAWSASAALGEGEALRETLLRLLTEAPRGGWRRVRLAAAIGPAASQVKRLDGLPPVKSPRVLAQLVAENAGRFFLRNGVPLRVTDVHVAVTGDVWAGAVEAKVLDDVADAARALGMRLDAARPTLAVLPYALARTKDAATAFWRDADTRADVVIDGYALVRARRLPALDAADIPVGLPAQAIHPALRALGDDAWQFADAYGAAVAPPRAPLAFHTHAGSDRGASWTRLAAAGVLVVASAAAALVAPALAASRTATRAAGRIEELRYVQRELARTQASLVQLSGTLRQLAAFGAERRSMLRLLGALSAATPESTAIVTLRVDGVAGSFGALTPRGAAVLPTLAGLDEITGATIAGPVTREQLGSQELERVTIRFRVQPPGRGRAGRREFAPRDDARRPAGQP